MAAFTTIATVASLLIGAASAAYSISQQEKAKDQEQERLDEEKRLALEAGQAEADKIRRRAMILKGEQKATIAGAGALMTSGTPQVLLAETDRLAEMDVLTALKDANARARLIDSKKEAVGDYYSNAQIGTGIGFAGQAISSAYDLWGAPSRTPGTIPDLVPTRTARNYSLTDMTIRDNFNLL